MKVLRESLTYDQADMTLTSDDEGKCLYMEGIFIQGGVKNMNGRIYPIDQIQRAVSDISDKINDGHSVLGECDHPDSLTVNLDRVTHLVTRMWMDGPNGKGKLKILPTPMGNIVKAMLENDVKLGVSSRGSGNEATSGNISDFEIVTVDIVAQPSAPKAYPTPMYESLYGYVSGTRQGQSLYDASYGVVHDRDHIAAKHFGNLLLTAIHELKLK